LANHATYQSYLYKVPTQFLKKRMFSMDGFDFKDGQLVCRRCGSRNVSVKAGMMTDRAWCNNCGNEDYC
jgi:late competence protein required for DNA uptake (superfamily II DNA/RNA helicase)